VKKLWKAKFSIPLIDFLNFGVFPRRSIPIAPYAQRVASEFSALSITAIRQRGIVADWGARGKGKVCVGVDGRSHPVHSFSTSQKTACVAPDSLIQKGILRKIYKPDVAPDKRALMAPEENSNYCEVFLSGRSNT
jgi:hypothetical protein